jgi:hypothetical protein
MTFQKGHKLSRGRPRIVLPEVQRAIDANREAVKTKILEKLNPKVDKWIEKIIETGSRDGDVQKFRQLLEIVFGRIPEQDTEYTDEERALIQAWRTKQSVIDVSPGVSEGSTGERVPDKTV